MATKKTAAKKGGAKGGAKKATGAKKAAAKGGSKAGAKSAAKKAGGAAKKAGGAKKAAKRAPNPSFMRPMQPDEALSAVVGSKPIPRTEITSKLWDYIRKNGLQDQKNRRQINADENLRKVFGGKKNVTMFEMTKLVNQHIGNA